MKLPREHGVWLLHQRGPAGCDISDQQSANPLRGVLKEAQSRFFGGAVEGIWTCWERSSIVYLFSRRRTFSRMEDHAGC